MKYLISFALVGLLTGCGSTPVKTAYDGSIGVDLGVRTTMTGWGQYVAYAHPSTNDELKVLNAFKAVQRAELTVIDAEKSYAGSPTNATALEKAVQAHAAAEADFYLTVKLITNAIYHP